MRRRPLTRRPDPPALVLVGLGLCCGLSPFFAGYYGLSSWGPLALVLISLGFALTFGLRIVPSGPLAVALAGLIGLWLWSFISRGWAEAGDRALLESGRWLLYAAMILVVGLLVRTRAQGWWLVSACLVCVSGVASYQLALMASGHGAHLFLASRLNDPLGYANGQAGFLLLGLWPAIALAERQNRLWSPIGVAITTALGSLLLLTQTRGIALAGAVSAVLVLSLIPGRVRRTWVVLFSGAAVAVVSGPLLAVYAHGATDATVGRAAQHALVASAAAGGLWALLHAALADVEQRIHRSGELLGRISRASLGAIAAATIVLGTLSAPQIGHTVDRGYRSFVTLGGSGQGAHFLTGGGNRYDYWRVAWTEFRHQPAHGVGAGNFDRDYFALRRTSEDIRQPHSLEFQTLAELGLVGALALLMFLGAVFWALGVAARRAARDRLERRLAVAAGGTFVAWLVHTSVDWLHLLPGVTGVALACAGVLLAPWVRAVAPGTRSIRRWTAAGAGAALAVFAISLVTVLLLVQHERSRARSDLARDPARAAAAANRALALDGSDTESYYVKAAALARLADYAGARDTLLAAHRREPHNFVVLGLLGDLSQRRGDASLARSYYRQASVLNPRDPELRALSERPSQTGVAGRSR